MVDESVDILLVEDNPNDLELTMHALHKNHLTSKVCVVRDGEEAINFFFEKKNATVVTLGNFPKVIFLDLKLPKIDGIEVIRRLKGDPRTITIPIVVLTSSQEDKDLREAYSLGVNSYIVKRVDFPQFVEVMRISVTYWLEYNQQQMG